MKELNRFRQFLNEENNPDKDQRDALMVKVIGQAV